MVWTAVLSTPKQIAEESQVRLNDSETGPHHVCVCVCLFEARSMPKEMAP